MKHTKSCLICYRIFEPGGPNSKYCGTECARRAMNAKQNDKRHQQREEKRQAKLPKMKSLAIVNAEARESGMTYGQYVALKGL